MWANLPFLELDPMTALGTSSVFSRQALVFPTIS
mgnify:FL=1|jgi:hypothetical protein